MPWPTGVAWRPLPGGESMKGYDGDGLPAVTSGRRLLARLPSAAHGERVAGGGLAAFPVEGHLLAQPGGEFGRSLDEVGLEFPVEGIQFGVLQGLDGFRLEARLRQVKEQLSWQQQGGTQPTFPEL